MSGCGLPVITNSGSGNQEIASSVPVIVYAHARGISGENLTRALVISNLLTIRQKNPIGRLSAFCGVVSAACSSSAEIMYLPGDGLIKCDIEDTILTVGRLASEGMKKTDERILKIMLEGAPC